jgi:flagellar motor switch protein FliM
VAVSQSEQHDQSAQDDDSAPEHDTRSIRALDFSLPTKFAPEVRRRLAAALTVFCEEAARSLEAELRCEVELEVGDVVQHTWASGKAELPTESLAVGIGAGAPDRQMLLSLELPIVVQALECMLGGEATHTPTERHLGEVDWVLARDLLDKLVADLSSAWTELGGDELSRGELDLEGDAGVLITASQPTLALSIQSRLGRSRSTMSLLVPWSCVEPLEAYLRGARAQAAAPGSEGEEELQRGLAVAQVLLRAEVGSQQMPIEQMLAIVPGTLVELGERADNGVRLIAEEIAIGQGRPGRSGTRRAVKLEIAGEPTRCETYATLGRSELERARALAKGEGHPDAPMLRSIFVRVWVELGRTHMPLGGALELAPGAVIELDQASQSPVELFANGLCFASGDLVVTPEGMWGVEVRSLL